MHPMGHCTSEGRALQSILVCSQQEGEIGKFKLARQQEEPFLPKESQEIFIKNTVLWYLCCRMVIDAIRKKTSNTFESQTGIFAAICLESIRYQVSSNLRDTLRWKTHPYFMYD